MRSLAGLRRPHRAATWALCCVTGSAGRTVIRTVSVLVLWCYCLRLTSGLCVPDTGGWQIRQHLACGTGVRLRLTVVAQVLVVV